MLDLATLTRRAALLWGRRTALVFDETGVQLSFQEIDAGSNRVANALHESGVQVGDRVALMLRNRPEFPLAWLGIIKAGAVMVPLNVYYRSVDAGYLINHAGVGAVLCEQDLVEIVTAAAPHLASGGKIFSVSDPTPGGLALRIRDAATEPPPHTVTAESPANIQYTSGTTGKPKGCMLSNAFFAQVAQRASIAQLGLDETDVLLTSQPFYYGDPQWNLALGLLVGAKLVVLDRFHPSTFWAKVRSYEVTWFYCLGVMPKLLLKTPVHQGERSHRVRWVTCSGIPARDHADIEERWGVPWYELYGMTESGLDITVAPEDHDTLVGSGCVGRPMANREFRVVGPDDRPLAYNETGELILRGTGLMDGYYRDPDATARTFRNGWLHTGDLGRMDERGLVYFSRSQKGHDSA